jgi:lipopolysaccharide/colanic/teichoic acid biosynthesis glycosyltransferase
MRNADLRQRQSSRTAAALSPVVVMPLPVGFRRIDDHLTCADPWTRRALIFKRIFDVAASGILLACVSPLFFALMAAIPLTSPGWPFFTHERIGLHGRTFRIFKFRTMSRGAHAEREKMVGEKDPERLLFKRPDDPRVTAVGRFLRRYSLDELPQLINVLRGEMSLVGPRPLLKEDFEVAGEEGFLFREWVRERHRLLPGLTGLWQVSGRHELSFEDSVRRDLEYVKQWTVGMDLRILLRTLPVVLSGRGAY